MSDPANPSDLSSTSPEQSSPPTTVHSSTQPPVSQGDVEAIQDGALLASGAKLPSEISPNLTPGAEELHMQVLDHESRLQKLEQMFGSAISAAPEIIQEGSNLWEERKHPLTLLSEVVGLLRRHFGPTAL